MILSCAYMKTAGLFLLLTIVCCAKDVIGFQKLSPDQHYARFKERAASRRLEENVSFFFKTFVWIKVLFFFNFLKQKRGAIFLNRSVFFLQFSKTKKRWHFLELKCFFLQFSKTKKRCHFLELKCFFLQFYKTKRGAIFLN